MRRNQRDGEEYYIQMMVEKIDLVHMFSPLCAEYHIPIVNAGGWYDILERSESANRFLEAEDNGLTPIILYFGDLDPWGIAISDFLHKGFEDIEVGTGWSPISLEVNRFGLSYDFIQDNHLTWIDNLVSGSGKDMSLMTNKIAVEYVAKYGVRKCEANAVMRLSARDATIQLCRNTIESYLGADVKDRFAGKREAIRDRLAKFKGDTGLDVALSKALSLISSID